MGKSGYKGKGGRNFELQWKNSVPDNIYHFKLRDSAASFGQDSASARFSWTNPYDFFIFYNGFFFPIELKSTTQSSFSIERVRERGKSYAIKRGQIDGLTKASMYDRIFAGFVFDMGERGTYWMDIKDFNLFLEENEKKSINQKDIIKYKGIEVDKKLKKVNYSYNVKGLLDSIIEGAGKIGR